MDWNDNWGSNTVNRIQRGKERKEANSVHSCHGPVAVAGFGIPHSDRKSLTIFEERSMIDE